MAVLVHVMVAIHVLFVSVLSLHSYLLDFVGKTPFLNVHFCELGNLILLGLHDVGMLNVQVILFILLVLPYQIKCEDFDELSVNNNHERNQIAHQAKRKVQNCSQKI